ncbi:MAG: DUF402 domain-containing protein [Solobacterium sp.]|nr:DUF402 domain-containing protein [Solobacterium sp.]
MEKLEIGKEVYIQSYKHNGSLHRTWCKGFVVDVKDNEYVVITNKAWVIEADGRKWLTREPAVCFFWTDRWYNVIAMIRKAGIYYYCNLATPSVFDGEAIKNIDYDLDVKLYPDRTYQILDEFEFEEHAQSMHYPENIKRIVKDQMQRLLHAMEYEQDPFNKKTIDAYYQKYLELYRNGAREE